MVRETLFRSEDVPAAERFDYWRELVTQTISPLDMSSDYAADFRGSLRLLELGAVHVSPKTLQSMNFHRTPQLIRQSDPETFHMSFVVRGGVGFAQAGQEVAYGPGDLCMVDSSKPFDCFAVNDRGPVKAVGVEVPKALLALAGSGGNEVVGRRITGREGFGALLAQFLTRITTDTGSFQASDGPRLGTIVLDLVSALFAYELDADNALTPETRRRTLTLRIRSIIQQHLADPRLTPRAVAAAHHISLSHLHRLFRKKAPPPSLLGSATNASNAPAATSPTPPCATTPSTGSPPAGDSPAPPTSPAPSAPITACHPGTTATHSASKTRRVAKHCALPANDSPAGAAVNLASSSRPPL